LHRPTKDPYRQASQPFHLLCLNISNYLATLLQVGPGSLAAYLAVHVLLCLLPVSVIAGVLFGVPMYLPTVVEVPIAQALL
jgi:hypothetical protein